MTEYKSFEEMPVWQKAHKLAVEIFHVSEHFPRKEDYGLTSQLRRAALSISANIAACPELAVSHRRAAGVRGTNGVEGRRLDAFTTGTSSTLPASTQVLLLQQPRLCSRN